MPRIPLVLAIDQGTTNTKAQLVARSGAIVAEASQPVPIAFPRPGWVEQDANALWSSVAAVIRRCVACTPDADLVAIGLTNQRESVTVWDRRTGAPVGPCVTWQCRRTAPFCADLQARGLEARIREVTGLPIDPLFSASKIAWLLEHVDRGPARAAQGELCVGTVDSWLLWNLTGGVLHATDATNASRTQLFSLRELQWRDELLEIFGIPRACLPEVRASSGDFGVTAATSGLPSGVPVRALVGDSHAALFGHAAFQPGATKATYGTGSSLMTVVAQGTGPVQSTHGLSSTVAWTRGSAVQYALEGNITNTGGAVQWLGECLGLTDPIDAVARLAASVSGTDGVFLVPAFAGLGAPYWDAEARGAIVGLTRGSTSAHLARAAIDAIAHQVSDVLEAIEGDLDSTPTGQIDRLLADGGASRNSLLMQRQADLAGRPVLASASADLAARGAAWLAGLAVNFWDSLESLARLADEHAVYRPEIDAAARRAARDGWRDAVARTRSSRPASPRTD